MTVKMESPENVTVSVEESVIAWTWASGSVVSWPFSCIWSIIGLESNKVWTRVFWPCSILGTSAGTQRRKDGKVCVVL